MLQFAVPRQGLPRPQFHLADKRTLLSRVSIVLKLHPEQIMCQPTIEVHAQFGEYVVEGVVLLLHFLVVASTLFGLAGADEAGHALEDLVRPPQLLEHEVSAVEFQEPVVQFVLLVAPVSLLHVPCLPLANLVLETRVFLLRLLLDLLAGQPDVTLLAEQRLEVVARDHLLVALQQTVDLLRAALLALYLDSDRVGALQFLGGGRFAVGGWWLVILLRTRLFGWISVAHRRIVR